MPDTYRKWVLDRPMVDDVLTPDQFALKEAPIPELEAGQALIRVKLINIHSATRARIANGATKPGDTDYSNYACAEVLKSRDKTFKEGDVIACQAGWQDHQVVSSESASVGYGAPSELVKALNGANSQWNYVFRPAMVKAWPSDVLMEMFGTSGMTAYFGLRECGPITPGDAVAVAGASGSVGSIAVQLAKAAGAYVVGFAGGVDRCRWVVETLGADQCLDYRADDFAAQLATAFPNGIDVFSDGVGGQLTETVMAEMNPFSRLFSFGGAAAFYADRLAAPAAQRPSLRRNFGISETVEAALKAKRMRSECWIVDEFYDERLKAEGDLSRLMRRGVVKPVNTVVDGFENLPSAIVGLYANPRAGKLQVRFEPEA
ncbi:MAG: NADP-dependent oxidoreductase [Phenylobacterium sp.]|uniref:MDR family NADP-dependent oxidoreductase n=1 Tax=Phenylobacterium sp. TaxID=1871053 RepID=UPI002732C4A4|nr:NADP-dependent oxidoreductase [Phenylobacterium sp.]MDP3172851.1 NADP-dependent oxidoreductase [Phenylobacterium sp.]